MYFVLCYGGGRICEGVRGLMWVGGSWRGQGSDVGRWDGGRVVEVGGGDGT